MQQETWDEQLLSPVYCLIRKKHKIVTGLSLSLSLSLSPVSRRDVAENTQIYQVYYCPLLVIRILLAALKPVFNFSNFNILHALIKQININFLT